MKARFLPAAAFELEAAADYYAEVGPGLGRDFRNEIRRLVTLISNHLRVGHVVNAGTKTALREFDLHRFPYRLIYSIEGDSIMIVAVAHQHRRSSYWRYRIEEPVPTYMTSRLAA
jgi:toxin ParE2